MTREELLALLAEVHARRSELDTVEGSSAKGGPPRRPYESLPAFANRPGLLSLGNLQSINIYQESIKDFVDRFLIKIIICWSGGADHNNCFEYPYPAHAEGCPR